MSALNDSGAIKGMDAREDGVYITYVPSPGADPVTKKLGNMEAVLLKEGHLGLTKLQVVGGYMLYICMAANIQINQPGGVPSSISVSCDDVHCRSLKSSQYAFGSGVGARCGVFLFENDSKSDVLTFRSGSCGILSVFGLT